MVGNHEARSSEGELLGHSAMVAPGRGRRPDGDPSGSESLRRRRLTPAPPPVYVASFSTAAAGRREAASMKELSECRVLIVDDVRSNVQLLAEALKGDYRISVALDGESALKAVAASQPDIVLLDIVMPGVDGYEVLRRLGPSPRHATSLSCFSPRWRTWPTRRGASSSGRTTT